MLRAALTTLVLSTLGVAHAYVLHAHGHSRSLQGPATPLRVPAAARLSCVEIYSKLKCPHCVTAKKFLKARGVAFTEIDVAVDELNLGTMLVRTRGARTVPQIFIDDRHVGGCSDMLDAAEDGTLLVSGGEILLSGYASTSNPPMKHDAYYEGLKKVLADKGVAMPA